MLLPTYYAECTIHPCLQAVLLFGDPKLVQSFCRNMSALRRDHGSKLKAKPQMLVIFCMLHVLKRNIDGFI
jgi:hypothetical protein